MPRKRNRKRDSSMTTERGHSPAEQGSQNQHKPGLKEKAVQQLREFLAMFIYLWVLFGLFALHQSIVLAQEHINYQAQGFAIINALILAKVMLIGEDLHLGNRFRDKPLLYSILYKTFLFSVFLISFHILEEVLVGVIRGKTIAQSFPAIGGGSLQGILSVGAIVFVALIPFFAFREIERVIGQQELRSLLLSPGNRVYHLQSRAQQ